MPRGKQKDVWNSAKDEKNNDTDNFFTYTTAHGFRHILDSNNTVHRILWAIVLLLSVTMLTFQLYELFDGFAKEPTASSVTTTFPTEFPVIVYCPHSWANVTKAREEFNMTTQKYLYLESLFPELQFHIKKEFFESWISDAGELKSVESEFQDVLSTYANGSVDELLMAISYEPEEVILEYGFNFDTETEKFITMSGMCYRVISNETYKANYETIKANYMLSINQLEDMFYNQTMYPDPKMNSFGFGQMMNSVLPQSEVYIRQRMHYYVKITYRVQQRVNLRRLGCDDTADASYSKLLRCAYECMSELCKTDNETVKVRKLYIPNNQGNLTLSDLASIFHYGTEGTPHCFENLPGDKPGEEEWEFSDACGHCNFPCRHESFSVMMSPIADLRDEEELAMIYITFNDPMNSLHIEEHLIYDPETLISNMGGAIGLWTGASMLSIIEAVYYFCCKSHRRR